MASWAGSMQQLGEYLIHHLIGQGGMGKVYEAEERLSRRRVALKVLRDDLAQSEDGRRMFLREMTILAHLDHPNIVRCLACTEAGGHLVMVLEHLQGHTLREWLRQQVRLHWQEAVRIAAGIAGGLHAAHGHQPPIVHRDLKPENVMILTDGRVKVMDFGIAKMLDAVGSQTVYTVGTLQYMSPEQIEGNAADARADLYCLGLVLYEMLAGQPPFASDSPRELLNLHCTQAPPRFHPDLSASLPPGLERLVFELLAKSPDQRPPHADAVRQRLEQLLAPAQPVHVESPTADPSPPGRSMGTLMLVEQAGAQHRRARMVGLVVALVGVVGLAAVGGVILLLRQGSGGGESEAVSERAPEPSVPVVQPPSVARETVVADEVRERAKQEREAEAARPSIVDAGTSQDETEEADEAEADSEGGGLLNRFGLSRDQPDDEPSNDDGLLGRIGL